MMIPKAKTVNITWLQNNLCSSWCFAIPQVERLIQSFNLGVESFCCFKESFVETERIKTEERTGRKGKLFATFLRPFFKVKAFEESSNGSILNNVQGNFTLENGLRRAFEFERRLKVA